MKKLKRNTSTAAQEVMECEIDEPLIKKPSFKKVISTGSTLLDLVISGGATKNGGVPGGIIIEVYGPSGSGKTAILASMAASVQARNGQVKFLDPEARLNKSYCRIYGMNLKSKDYYRPDRVDEMFDHIYDWQPKNSKVINMVASDSLAALTTDWEMAGQDEMGMRRAKKFSEGLRKTARVIANHNWIVACSNQERMGPKGTTTPGGKGIPYYASLRIRISPKYPKGKIYRQKKVGSKTIKKVVGIVSDATITKSSIDEPWRVAPIYIMFNYGIDDIQANLQWTKEVTGAQKYDCIDKKLATIDKAIHYIEEHNLEKEVRKLTIDLWKDIERKFSLGRKRKIVI